MRNEMEVFKDKMALSIAKQLPRRVQYWAAIEFIGRFLSSHPETAPTKASIADLMTHEEDQMDEKSQLSEWQKDRLSKLARQEQKVPIVQSMGNRRARRARAAKDRRERRRNRHE
jgi:hypothetical protein